MNGKATPFVKSSVFLFLAAFSTGFFPSPCSLSKPRPGTLGAGQQSGAVAGCCRGSARWGTGRWDPCDPLRIHPTRLRCRAELWGTGTPRACPPGVQPRHRDT